MLLQNGLRGEPVIQAYSERFGPCLEGRIPYKYHVYIIREKIGDLMGSVVCRKILEIEMN